MAVAQSVAWHERIFFSTPRLACKEDSRLLGAADLSSQSVSPLAGDVGLERFSRTGRRSSQASRWPANRKVSSPPKLEHLVPACERRAADGDERIGRVVTTDSRGTTSVFLAVTFRVKLSPGEGGASRVALPHLLLTTPVRPSRDDRTKGKWRDHPGWGRGELIRPPRRQKRCYQQSQK